MNRTGHRKARSFGRAISLFLVFCMVFAFMPVSFSMADGSLYKDGTYEGKGSGYNNGTNAGDNIVVDVTVEDDNIKNIVIKAHNGETQDRWAGVESLLPSLIVATQSTSVDAVSGATLSSRGIVEAVENALSKAFVSDDSENSSNADLEAGVYSVPLNAYLVTQDNAYGANTPVGQSITVQFNDRALVTTEGPGSGYTVKLQYQSRSLYDFMQVVAPDKLSEVKNTYPNFYKMPAGTFNISSELQTEIVEGYAPNVYGITPYTSVSAISNQYFLQPPNIVYSSGSAIDVALDTGYIEFTTPNLTDEVLVKAWSKIVSLNESDEVAFPYDIMLRFIPSAAVRLPDSLTFDSGNYTLGWAWTSYKTFGSVISPPSSDTYIPDFLESEVSATVDAQGKITAVFDLKSHEDGYNDGKDTVVTLRKATGRNMNLVNMPGGVTKNRWLDYNAATWETIDISEGKFTLNYEDMAFGVFLSAHTRYWEAQKNNGTTTDTVYFAGWLRLEPAAATDETQSENGVTLSYLSTAVPQSASFGATKRLEYSNGMRFATRDNFIQHVALATPGRYAFYTVSLMNGGERISPQIPVTLRFPLPAEWDADKLLFYQWRRAGQPWTNRNIDFSIVGEGENRFIEMNTKNIIDLNTDYFIAEQADKSNLSEATDGLYKASVSLMHSSREQPSMANGTIKDGNGVIEIKDGNKTLYLELQPMDNGIVGYLDNIFTYPGGVKTSAEHLAYYTSGEVTDNMANSWMSEYGLNYPKRLSLTLGEPDADGYYRPSFIIPIMDGMVAGGIPGSGVSAQSARLSIASLEEISGEWGQSPSNPLAGYDKSVIAAKINDAQRLIAELSPATDGARMEELAAAVIAARSVYNNASATSTDIKNARDALAAVVGTTGGGPGTSEPEPEDKDDSALAQGDYPVDIKLWNFSANQASMGNGALAHDQSFVRVGSDGKAEAHLFFGPLTFTGLTGHLERISLVTDIKRDGDGIITGYDKTPATVLSDYGTMKDEFGPINIASYPREVSIPVEIGKTYTNVEVFVPVMEKAVGGAGTQLARLQIDWSALGVTETPDPGTSEPAPEPPVTKAPEATVTVTVTPEIKTDDNGSVGGKTKIVENAVSSENKTQIAEEISTKAKTAVSEAKAKAEEKIEAGTITASETVIAEVVFDTRTNTDVSEIKETVTNLPAAAITAMLAAPDDVTGNTGGDNTESAKVETVLKVLTDLASVTLDSTELADIVSKVRSADTVAITFTATETDLSVEQEEAIPADKVPFSIEIAAGDTEITGKLASPIAVTIPYPQAVASGKKAVVWYVAADGSKTKLDATYDAASRKLTFVTTQI